MGTRVKRSVEEEEEEKVGEAARIEKLHCTGLGKAK